MDLATLIEDLNGFEIFALEDAIGTGLDNIEAASKVKLTYALLWISDKRTDSKVKWADIQRLRLNEVMERLGLNEEETEEEQNLES